MFRDEADFHASVFILRPDRKITLVRKQRDGQIPGNWTLPGGKKRQTKDLFAPRRGERPAETVVREVKEETGLLIKKRKLVYLGSEEVIHPVNGPYNKHFFFFHSYSKKGPNPLSAEYEAARDFHISEAHEIEGFDPYYYQQYVLRFEPFLEDYLAGRQ